ncbi:TIGR02710 family CRISPR-associated protein [Planctomycetales bacterium]|nr:TIGR02710 family CRISPR-associated protein [Planctomycetales bacterium]
MKLHIATVGTGRNREDIAKAIAFSISNIQPDKALLFTSHKTLDETFPFVQCELGQELEKRCESVCFDNEDDVQFLFTNYIERIQSELKKYEEKPVLYVDFTSGTKAMTAALFAAGIALDADEVCYVTGKRDEGGRVIESETVNRIEPKHIIAERTVSEALQLFNNGNYQVAANMVMHIKKLFDKNEHLGNLAHTIFALGQSYAAWDKFEWKQAAKLLKDNRKVFEKETGIVNADFLAEQAEFCEKLAKENYVIERVVDLYANAQRRFKLGRFDDAMSRLYRGLEYLVQIQLHNKFQLDTDNPQWRKYESKLCEATKANYEQRERQKRLQLGLRDAMELLAELNDPLGLELVKSYWHEWSPGMEFIKNNSGKLQDYLNQRNNSYLAHGTKPVEKRIVENLLKLFDEFLRHQLSEQFDDLLKTAAFVSL